MVRITHNKRQQTDSAKAVTKFACANLPPVLPRRSAGRYELRSSMRSILLMMFVFLAGCSITSPKPDLQSYSNSDDKFPASNSGKNTEYYPITTNMDWPIRVSPDELENYVTWNHAIDLILDGQVKNIFQAHTLSVGLELESGIWVSTIEPSIDTVLVIIRKCGVPCKNIGQMIE